MLRPTFCYSIHSFITPQTYSLSSRFKPEMWAKVAEEMGVPWRAAEAMHWQLGEAEMARRAGVVPFSLSNPTSESNASLPRSTQPPPPSSSQGLGHAHSHSHSGIPPITGHTHIPGPGAAAGARPNTPYQRNVHNRTTGATRSIAARRDSVPRSVAPPLPVDSLVLAGIRQPIGMGRGNGSGGQMLPGVVEMTTRVSPYSTPAYSVSGSGYPSPGPLLPAIDYREGSRQVTLLPEGKRGNSQPDTGRESMRRRQYE